MSTEREKPWQQDLRLRMEASGTPHLARGAATPNDLGHLRQLAQVLCNECARGEVKDDFFFDVYRCWLLGVDLEAVYEAAQRAVLPPCLPSLKALARVTPTWAETLQRCYARPKRERAEENKRYNLHLPREQSAWLDAQAEVRGESPQAVVRALIQDAMEQP